MNFLTFWELMAPDPDPIITRYNHNKSMCYKACDYFKYAHINDKLKYNPVGILLENMKQPTKYFCKSCLIITKRTVIFLSHTYIFVSIFPCISLKNSSFCIYFLVFVLFCMWVLHNPLFGSTCPFLNRISHILSCNTTLKFLTAIKASMLFYLQFMRAAVNIFFCIKLTLSHSSQFLHFKVQPASG